MSGISLKKISRIVLVVSLLYVCFHGVAKADTFGNFLDNFGSGNPAVADIQCYPFSPSTSGTVSSMSGEVSDSASGKTYFAIYDNTGSGGDAGNLLASDVTGVTSPTTQGWATSSISLTVTSGTTYYLCEAGTNSTWNYYYTDGGAISNNNLGWTPTSWPDPFGAAANHGNRKQALYATYSPGIAAGTPSNPFAPNTVNVSLIGPSTLYMNLVAWYTFDGKNILTSSVRDSSGNAFNGTLTNYTTTTVVPGKTGQALSFNATGNYVAVGNATTSIQTVSFWMKAATSTNEQIMELNGTQTVSSSGGTISANGFGGTTVIYVDGVVSSTIDTRWHLVTITTTTSFNANAFNLGKIGTGYYGGTLDDVRLYQRVLSAQEVAELYYGGAGSKLSTSFVGPQGLNTGLVGWWTFDGKNMIKNVADSSSNNNNGNLTGGAATSSIVVPGKIGQALKLNNGGYVSIADAPSLRECGSFSISTWINLTGLPANFHIQNVLLKSDSTGNFNYSFIMSNQHSLQGHVQNGWVFQYNNTTGSDFVAYQDVTLKTGVWTHLTGTWDSVNMIESLYLNGVLASSTVQTIVPTCSSGGVFQLSADNVIAESANEILDDTRLYSRLLSAQEVAQLYQIGAGSKVATSRIGPQGLNTGLVGWYTFDGKNMITRIKDSSGHGYDLDGQGFTSTSSAVTPGRMGQALSFDGSTQYASSTVNIDLTATPTVSLSFWANLPSMQRSAIQTVLYLNQASGFGFEADDNAHGDCSSGPPDVVVFDFKSGFGQNCYAAPTAGVWHHYVATLDRSTNTDTVQLYIDGSLQSTVGGTATVDTSGTTGNVGFYIGSAGGTQFTQGKVDDVRIYDHVLSAQEVKQLYYLGK